MRGNHLAYAATLGIYGCTLEWIIKYLMARRVLMVEVEEEYGVYRGRLDGWCEGGLGQQRNDVEDSPTIREG